MTALSLEYGRKPEGCSRQISAQATWVWDRRGFRLRTARNLELTRGHSGSRSCLPVSLYGLVVWSRQPYRELELQASEIIVGRRSSCVHSIPIVKLVLDMRGYWKATSYT